MTNREIGLVWMADIPNRLYDGWPRQISLDLPETREATKVGPEDQREAARLWGDLWEWLGKEGIVRVKASSMSSTRIDFAVLTTQGFAALNKPVPGSEQSWGSKMGAVAKSVGKDAATAGAKAAATEAIKASGIAQTMGEFFGGIIKGASS